MPVGMKHDVACCPRCGSVEVSVTSSRKVSFAGFNTVRRRRDCGACYHRWHTVEISQPLAEHAMLDDLAAELAGEG